jgi:hypothetical protein
MYKLFAGFCDFFAKSYSFLFGAAVLGASILMSELALAQGGGSATTISVETPNINWGTVAADLVSSLTTVAVVGLGIAISLWVLFLVAKVFKRSAT